MERHRRGSKYSASKGGRTEIKEVAEMKTFGMDWNGEVEFVTWVSEERPAGKVDNYWFLSTNKAFGRM